MPSDKRHRAALYTLVVLLAIIQIITFVVVGIQVSRISVKIDSGLAENERQTENLINSYNTLYQENFKEISSIIITQEENFNQKINLLKSSQDDFSGIAKEAVKSVVTISTGSSLGSGFIVNSAGYLVTNNHVIAGKENEIVVLTYDRKNLPATLVVVDNVRDIALLKIEGEFSALSFADKEDIQVGEKVIAIGNPLGLSFTVTEGIISALDRTGPSGLNEYIQTDVSLNPGNSGGPLIDKEGKVVGINNFKIGGAESLGFSLESQIIKESINSLTNSTIIS